MKKIALYLLFFLNLGVILGFWWWGSSGELLHGDLANKLLALGKLSGLMAVTFVLLQFVLRGRAIWIEEVFGLNNLSTVHRLNGYLALFFILLHPILITTSYSMLGKVDIVSQFVEMVLHYDDVWMAFIAVLLFICIVGVSIYIVRKRLRYEVWYYIHLLTYFAIFLAWGHQLKLGGDFHNQLFVYYWYGLYIFVFGNLLFFRFFRQLFLFYKHRFVVEKVVPEAGDAVSIYITGRAMDKFAIKPGQFLILRFLTKKLWWETHPFSLSFVPKENMLRVTVKNVGDFTSQMPGLKKGTKLLLDGPLGTFTAANAVGVKGTKETEETKVKFLFIAGGVGITPIRSLIEELGAKGKDMTLLYSNKTSGEMTFKNELDSLRQQYKFPLFYIVTQEPGYKGETGRIDADKIKRLVPDFLERDIYLCGPPPMMEALVKTLKEMEVKSPSIHYEKFSL